MAYCVLSFRSLEQWYSLEWSSDSTTDSDSSVTSSCRSTIIRAAESNSDGLMIVVRVDSASLNPWDPAVDAASASSSSAPLSLDRQPQRLGGPARHFLALEQSLAQLYSIATDSYVRRDLVLARVDVVVEPLRRQPVCLPSDAPSFKWDYDDAVARWEVTATQPGKGKAMAAASDEQVPVTGPASDDETGPDLFPVVALGGTFDHLHAGHKILLTMAASLTSRKLIVGVTDDALLVNKKHRDLLEPLDVRTRHVEQIVALIRPEIECACVPLQDVYGPTANDPEIEALVVSEETRAGGEAINKLRAEKSLSILRVFCISLVADSSSSSSSSTPDSSDPISAGKSDSGPGTAAAAAGKVVVSPATKMGSTGIREWLAKRRQRENEEQRRQQAGEGQ